MDTTDATPRPRGTVRFGRLGSTDLLARPSLLLMGAVIAVLFAPRFAGDSTDRYVVAVVFVLALYLSVLAHELAHVAVARAFGLRVPRVTLHLLGGETIIAGGLRTPTQEVLTSIVGPVASGLVGATSLALVDATSSPATQQVLWSLGWINLLVGAFNLLPALPLDGGRVLAAAVWARTGRQATGVRAACTSGRVVAGALVLVVAIVRLGETGGLLDVAIALLVGAFLWAGAGQALRTARHLDHHDPTGRPS
ncbi:M50 family metallopeptidase [Aeromicrobium sp. CF4.19]|uniref:M50 family metallopeptidase n=1 Tax=Aeromicrobium sp. CF4.19 TaxID=3373082 RepID=UPI003EE4BAB2